jgi:hypothetical protein
MLFVSRIVIFLAKNIGSQILFLFVYFADFLPVAILPRQLPVMRDF